MNWTTFTGHWTCFWPIEQAFGSHGITLTVRKFRRLAVQSSVWTKRNYWTVPCKWSVRPKSFIPSKIRPVQCKRSLNLIQSARLVSTSLQYSSKILKHLCAFSLPQCWFGYYIRLSALKYALLNIGEGEGHIWVRTKVWRVNDLWQVL